MQPVDQSRELAQQLQKRIQGEVRFDPLYRQLYSTDASNYRVLPVGVVLPRHADDISAALEIAAACQASVVPRGSGSSLSGQAIGPGVIIDCSRWLDHILEIHPVEGWARVEAGVRLDQLNAALIPHQLMVGPNPASSSVATLGGMAANNSTGSHSIRYGMMVDHVIEMEVVLSNGRQYSLKPKSTGEVATLARKSDLEGNLYRQIPPLMEEYRSDIQTGYPHTWRNVAGYNLNRLLDDEKKGSALNLASVVVGSEGTLALIHNLTVRLVPRPRLTRLVVLHFSDPRQALEQVPWILEASPTAVELLDRQIIQRARLHPAFRPRLEHFVQGDPRSLLVVEFSGDEPGQLEAQSAALERSFRGHGCQDPVVHCTTPEQVETVWSVRRDVNGLIMSQPGDTKALSFVDDVAVPVEDLPVYADEVRAACQEYGVEINFDGHASAGCLHMNPSINLKTIDGLERMQKISQAVMHIAMRHHGTTTGEHGEGFARSYYNRELYGERLHRAFRQLKSIFDPANHMNPGKIVEAPEPWDPELLRFNPGYRAPLAPVTTFFDFTPHSGFAGLVEMCNGQGVCRALGEGVMCPSYRVTREEMHSTRGRANALRAAMTGELGAQGMTSQALYDCLDLCLECKACKSECSSLVDMARLKSEFLAQYQAKHGLPLRNWLFANVSTLYHFASLVPALSNWALRQPLFRQIFERLLEIDQRRGFPSFARQTFQAWFKVHRHPLTAPRGPVVLWDDTYLSYNEPEIGIAAVGILEAAGYEVRLIPDRWCCGRPMISKGVLSQAHKNAQHNVACLAPLAAQGIPILGLEPSCIATFRDEYPALLRSQDARLVAEHSYFIEEFLTSPSRQGEFEPVLASHDLSRKVLLHGHCYQKALGTTSALTSMVHLIPNIQVEETPSGCCGMAGAFGYEKEHYPLSMACGEDRLFPAVRAASSDTVIAAAGISCRQQIRDGTGRQVIHPILILAEALVK
jgi:FAD/FMN-containing dehydrogenase/Fe-S oxidoreductase